MTTPYGTTTFAYTAPGTAAPPRFAQATDPMGFSEREEWLEPAPIPSSDPVAAGAHRHAALSRRTVTCSFATASIGTRTLTSSLPAPRLAAATTPRRASRSSPHVAAGGAIKGMALESTKQPLENESGTLCRDRRTAPTAGLTTSRRRSDACSMTAGRSSTATRTTPRPFQGHRRSPIRSGRRPAFTYANGIDLIAVTQVTRAASVAAAVWGRRPVRLRLSPSASCLLRRRGPDDAMAYNAAGRLTAVTNPLSQTTEYQYDTARNISTVINANSALTPATPTTPSRVAGPSPIRKVGRRPTATMPPTASPRRPIPMAAEGYAYDGSTSSPTPTGRLDLDLRLDANRRLA